jgi:hypothetical protein
MLIAMKSSKTKRLKTPLERKTPPEQESEEELLNKAFLMQANIVFEEWNSDEDEAAFRDL